jgi:hypothetical protein
MLCTATSAALKILHKLSNAIMCTLQIRCVQRVALCIWLTFTFQQHMFLSQPKVHYITYILSSKLH